jgi:CheY-like chemotaxis protein
MDERILIVDDDDFVCQMNGEILSDAGYQVHFAKDGLAALEKMQGGPDRFDLVLLDKHMPRLDGLDFLRRLKSDASARDVPVIMLTGDNRQEDVIEGLDAGAYYYLTKPSEEAVLKQVVKNALDEAFHKRDLRALIGQRTPGLQSMTRAEFTIRTTEEAKSLAIVLADASRAPSRTVTGYSELLLNAIEHGNLGISYDDKSRLMGEGRWAEEVERRLHTPPFAERWVTVLLARHGGGTTVTISDEGEGFDWRKYLEFDPERAFDLHGRGIAMAKSMSFDDIRYIGTGSTVILTVCPKRRSVERT